MLQRLVRTEHRYEGMFGVSPRTLQNMVSDLIGDKEHEEAKSGIDRKCLSIFRIFEGLKNLLDTCDDDFVTESDSESEDYRHPEALLVWVKEEYENLIEREVKWSFIGLDDNILDNKIKEYVDHARAFNLNGKVHNPITQREEEPDEDKMGWVEDKIGIESDARPGFRRAILRRLGESIINRDGSTSDGKLDYREMYAELYLRLEDGLFKERIKDLKLSNEQILSGLEKFDTPDFNKLERHHKKTIEKVISNMVSLYDYCDECAREVLIYSVKEGYIGNN
jgi:predicted Ser/Thr protein kinase